MDHSGRKRLALDYMRVWNAGNEDVLDKLAVEDIEVSYTHFEKVYKGVEAYKEALRMTHSYFPDIRIEVGEVLIADDKAIVSWVYTGTHRQGNLFGTEPAGTQVDVSGISILEFKNGKVTSEKGIVDNLALVMQLGLFDKLQAGK